MAMAVPAAVISFVLILICLFPAALVNAQPCDCNTFPCFICGVNANQSCPAGNCSCTSPSLFSGPTCTQCTSNSSCTAPEYCDRTPRVSNFKEFDCALSGNTLDNSLTFLGVSHVSYTFVRDPSIDDITITEIGYNYAGYGLVYECHRFNCSQVQVATKSVITTCSTVSCRCPGCTNPIANTTINALVGLSTMTCTYAADASGNHDCTLDQEGAPIPVTGSCFMSECTANATIPIVGEKVRIKNENAIIWAYFLGLALLLVLGLIGAFGEVIHRIVAHTSTNEFEMAESKRSVRLVWTHINYTVTGRKFFFTEKHAKQVINDVNGVAEAGQLLAIMGPSGAGKSTMLDILFGLPMRGTLRGDVLANGEAVGGWFANDCGYVQQEDTLQAHLTVREQLLYAAELRLPSQTYSKRQKEQRVEKVMRDLRLTEVADSIIGGRLRRGLSGGEKKRVQIGMELVTAPPVLFVDEPTSGLDAHNAFLVMTALKEQAKAGRTVIVAIHQPRSSIYALFDKILLLHHGRVLFTGSTDSLRNWVEKQLNQTIPVDVNAADFLFDYVLEGKPEDADNLVQRFKNQPEEREVSERSDGAPGKDRDIEPLSRPRTNTHHKRLLRLADGDFKTAWIHQYYILLKYQVLALLRNPVLLPAHFIFAIGAALYLDDQFVGFQNRCGAVFASLVLLAFTNMSVVDMIVSERAMFENERLKRYYRLSAYLLSRVLVPVAVLNIGTSIVFVLINYWMVGYRGVASIFFWFLSGLTLSSLAAATLLIAIAALCRHLTIAVLVATLSLLTMMLFSGFLVHTATIPVFIRWLQWLSFFRYAYEAMLSAELTGLVINAVPKDLVPTAVYFDGSQLVGVIGLRADRGQRDLAVLIGMAVGLLLLTYLYLRFRRVRR